MPNQSQSYNQSERQFISAQMKVRFTVIMLHVTFFWKRIWKKMKLNEPGRQKLQRQNFWRNMQKLYVILLTYSIKQRPGSPTVTHTWHASKYKVHKLHQRYILFIKLLCLCDVFRALINSLVVLILHERSRSRSVADCNLLQT